jgi:hypothetical protein
MLGCVDKKSGFFEAHKAFKAGADALVALKFGELMSKAINKAMFSLFLDLRDL